MLWHPEDARDATQEILIRIITHLGSFRFESSFQTWAYHVACNHLRTLRKLRMERMEMTFEQFADDLAEGLAAEESAGSNAVERALLLEEVKIGCTLGMLLCLSRELRLAFVLGDVLELDGVEAAAILEVSPATFRKRLSRARATVISFTRSHCGLINPENPCRCSRRINRARELGRLDPQNLFFAHDRQQAVRFPAVLRHIRELDESRRAVALYQSHTPQTVDLTAFVRQLRVMTGVVIGIEPTKPDYTPHSRSASNPIAIRLTI